MLDATGRATRVNLDRRRRPKRLNLNAPPKELKIHEEVK